MYGHEGDVIVTRSLQRLMILVGWTWIALPRYSLMEPNPGPRPVDN